MGRRGRPEVELRGSRVASIIPGFIGPPRHRVVSWFSPALAVYPPAHRPDNRRNAVHPGMWQAVALYAGAVLGKGVLVLPGIAAENAGRRPFAPGRVSWA